MSNEMRLYECVPDEFFDEFQDTKAFSFRDVVVIATYENTPFPGKHKNVNIWWKLKNGYAVGWNENPGRGWSFPVVKIK